MEFDPQPNPRPKSNHRAHRRSILDTTRLHQTRPTKHNHAMRSPSPNTVKTHLTNAIRKSDLTTVSANQIRRIVETELNLSEKRLSSEKWKVRVKTWIQEVMMEVEEGVIGDVGDEGYKGDESLEGRRVGMISFLRTDGSKDGECE